MLPDSFIEELKYVSNIETTVSAYVNLQKKGHNFVGLCPFHSEKTPSFTVYTDTASYYCFGCGNGGDVITFIKNIENLEYIEAIKYLAEKNGLVFPDNTDDSASILKTKILEINRESARYFNNTLMSDIGQKARNYLINRGFTSKSIRHFGVGFAPDSWDSLLKHLKQKGYTEDEIVSAAVVNKSRNNDSVFDTFRDRVIFPIIDLRGNVIGFGGRLLGENGPKYLNSSDTPVFKKSRNLFALNFAKADSRDTIILGEGYMDVMAMHQAGFENSVATLGTALTEDQARLLARYTSKVVIAYDADGAGQNATKRAINIFSKTDISVSVLQLDGAKDPDEYIQKFGAARFSNLLEEGKSAIMFEIDKIKTKYDFNLSEEKVGFLNEFANLMADVDNQLQREVYIGEISDWLNVDKGSIITTVNAIRKRKYRSKEREESKALARGISTHMGTESKKPNKNIRSISAEENLIMLLLNHPDYYKKIVPTLEADEFSDSGYGAMYSQIKSRIDSGGSLELIYFAEALSGELISKLSSLIIKGKNLKFYPQQAAEYTQIIRKENDRKNSQELSKMTDEEYLKYIQSLRDSKTK